MLIKFKRGAAHLGYSYRKGSIAASLPDKDCEYLIKVGIAIDITPKEKKVEDASVEKDIVKVAAVSKSDVKTADVKRKKKINKE
jgi:hypothetical protein